MNEAKPKTDTAYLPSPNTLRRGTAPCGRLAQELRVDLHRGGTERLRCQWSLDNPHCASANLNGAYLANGSFYKEDPR